MGEFEAAAERDSPRSPPAAPFRRTAAYTVVAEPEGKTVGTLDEDFAMESLTGDVFLLGTHSWRIRHVMQGRVYVEDAHGAAPSIPVLAWRSSGEIGRAIYGSVAIAKHACLPSAGFDWLKQDCGLDEAGASQAIAYVRAGAAALGALPSCDTVVAERFFDEAGGMQLVLHAPFGSRVNRAWGLGAAQALLPHVQLRTTGRGDRQRHRDFVERPSCLSARAGIRVPEGGDRAGCSDAGDARCADVRNALAVECDSCTRDLAFPGRHESSGADPEDALG